MYEKMGFKTVVCPAPPGEEKIGMIWFVYYKKNGDPGQSFRFSMEILSRK